MLSFCPPDHQSPPRRHGHVPAFRRSLCMTGGRWGDRRAGQIGSLGGRGKWANEKSRFFMLQEEKAQKHFKTKYEALKINSILEMTEDIAYQEGGGSSAQIRSRHKWSGLKPVWKVRQWSSRIMKNKRSCQEVIPTLSRRAWVWTLRSRQRRKRCWRK